MKGLSVYIAREIAIPFVLFTVSLTALVWLSQSLRVLDVVVNQGQSAATFVTLALFLVPQLLSLILPVAMFCAVLFSLHRLQTDSELVVMWSAGFSRWSAARPVLLVALCCTAAVYAINLYFMPAGMRAFKDRVYEIRGDLVSAFLREGTFTTPAEGITAYVRETDPSGLITNIFVHDSRRPGKEETYLAEHGRIVRTPDGPRLVMWNGTIQRQTTKDRVALMDFDRYTFDISQFASDAGGQIRETSERYLPELLHPDRTNVWDNRYWKRLLAEGHGRLSSPLYAIVMTMVALYALVAGQFTRRAAYERIAGAAVAALLIRLAGVGLQSLAAIMPPLNVLQYLLPLALIAGLALMLDRNHQPFGRSKEEAPAAA